MSHPPAHSLVVLCLLACTSHCLPARSSRCLPARRCGISSCCLKRTLASRCLPARRCGISSCCLKRTLAERITSVLESRKGRSRLRAGKTSVSQKAVKGGLPIRGPCALSTKSAKYCPPGQRPGRQECGSTPLRSMGRWKTVRFSQSV